MNPLEKKTTTLGSSKSSHEEIAAICSKTPGLLKHGKRAQIRIQVDIDLALALIEEAKDKPISTTIVKILRGELLND